MLRMAWEKAHRGETSSLAELSYVLRSDILLWEGVGLQEVKKLIKINGPFRSSETPCIAGNPSLLFYPRAILHEHLGKKFSEEGQAEKVSTWELG